MAGGPTPRPFDWYDEQLPRVYPPRSVFILLLAAALAVSLPAGVLWLVGKQPALYWLGWFAPLLFGGLLLDVVFTYRRYRTWAGEWLCADCRRIFLPVA